MKPAPTALARLGIPLSLGPMEALLVTELPKDAQGWQFEPKWDGFRCLAFRAGRDVEIKAKIRQVAVALLPRGTRELRRAPARDVRA